MNTLKHIQAKLRTANLAEVSRQTGISVRRLFQIRDGAANVTMNTFNTLEKWVAKPVKQ